MRGSLGSLAICKLLITDSLITDYSSPMDLIFRHANLPDGRINIDVGIEGQMITAAAENLPATAAVEVDAKGKLLSPPFVDAHFHLDAALSLGLPRLNRSGTLLEGIALWGELKPELTHEAVAARALAYCDMAVAQGLLAIRSHVDVCDDRLLAVETAPHKSSGRLSGSTARRVSPGRFVSSSER